MDNTVKIGSDMIDIEKPCDVLAALKKMQLKVGVGGVRETVRFDGEEITFTRANDGRLAKLIREYESKCPVSGANKRTRYAKRIRFN